MIAQSQQLYRPDGSASPAKGYGLMVVRSNKDIEATEKEQYEKQQALSNPVFNGLSTFVSKSFDEAVSERNANGVDQELIKDLAQRKGEYTEDQKAAIEAQGEPLIFDNQTEVKCSAGNAWISDVIVFQPDERPWSLTPTPRPDLPQDAEQEIVERVMLQFVQAQMQGQIPVGIGQMAPDQQQLVMSVIQQQAGKIREQVENEIQEEAKDRARRMEALISDQLEEGGFADAFDDFLENFCTFRTAFLKGPVVCSVDKIEFIPHPGGNGAMLPSIIAKLKYQFSAPSPFDIYPSRETVIPAMGTIHERVRFRRTELEALFGTEGVNDDELVASLREHTHAGSMTFQATDSQRAQLEDKNFWYDPKETIEGVYFQGAVRGFMLNDWFGSWMRQGPFEEWKDYPIYALVVGKRVIKVIPNPDPLGGSIYHMASYRRVNGSFWGKSIPFLMRDKQKMINAAARNLCLNMSFASGPMAWADPSGAMDGEIIEDLHARQIIQLRKRPDGSTAKPLEFFKVDSHAQELMGIRAGLVEQCHDDTGIPPYQYGNADVGGAGQTASGLSMLMTSAARGIKKAIANIDKGVIKPMIRRLWLMNMLYHPDDSVKGDMDITARGAMALFVRDTMTMRRINILGTTNNPTDMMIFGIKGRAAMWKEVFKASNMPMTDILPTDAELEQRIQAAGQQMQMQQQQKLLAPSNNGAKAEGVEGGPRQLPVQGPST